jgi:D-beta-D-heptose 7-phosphate kinase/D-beta-D-heptose 1-phosphate adenosyltransferase
MKTVFTNGCFDILHIGHIKLLEFCKQQGDYVIVGLNSDESIKRLKGEKRPINNEHNRLNILKSIKYVDQVFIFNEDTPYELIKILNPDIIVKGGDYKKEEVVGNDLTEVIIFNYIDGYSTTKTLEKLNDICI